MAYSSNDDDLLKYYDLIFVCVIITRFFHFLLDTIIYNQFARLILYYLDKKKNLVRLRSISYDERKFTLSGFQRFVIFWVCFLFALKISTALIDLTWLTYFQLNRGRTEIDYLIWSMKSHLIFFVIEFDEKIKLDGILQNLFFFRADELNHWFIVTFNEL